MLLVATIEHPFPQISLYWIQFYNMTKSPECQHFHGIVHRKFTMFCIEKAAEDYSAAGINPEQLRVKEVPKCCAWRFRYPHSAFLSGVPSTPAWRGTGHRHQNRG